jgi:hypothetical protein
MHVVTRKGQGNQASAAKARDVVRPPQIACIRPEAARSNPGQDEVKQLFDGSPLPVLSSIRSGDLGIEVKC